MSVHWSQPPGAGAACGHAQRGDVFSNSKAAINCPECRITIGLDQPPGDRNDTGEDGDARKVISLAERRAEPVADVVEQLERLLERARRGEIRGLATATTASSGSWSTAYVLGDTGLAPLNLAVDLLKSRLLANPTE